jgi:hypothetical protein
MQTTKKAAANRRSNPEETMSSHLEVHPRFCANTSCCPCAYWFCLASFTGSQAALVLAGCLLAIPPTLMIKPARSSETSVNYQDTRRHTPPEGRILDDTMHLRYKGTALIVTHLEAYFPRLVVFDRVKHIMGILTGIWNTEEETQ